MADAMVEQDITQASAENSDREVETFEDAPDRVSRPPLQERRHSRKRSNASARSLTERSASAASVRSLTDRRMSSSSNSATPRVSKLQATPKLEGTPDMNEAVSPTGNLIPEEPSKSPLLTARRVSNFDEVQLNEGDIKEKEEETRGRSTTTSSDRSNASDHSRSSTSASRPRLPNKAVGTVNSVPSWTQAQQKPHMAPPASRKLSSPFSWLSRKKNAQPTDPPPQQSNATSRRGTAASLVSVGSQPELMLSRLEDGHAHDSSNGQKSPATETLRDRFKMLRLREETSIVLVDSENHDTVNTEGGVFAGLVGRSASVGLGIGSPTSLAEDGEAEAAAAQEAETKAQSTKSSRTNSLAPVLTRQNSVVANVNPNMAPGTASGISQGPSAMQDPICPIDWDLWQSVVYEGPSAVAKTSAEDLSRGIASGIPNPIRGVVWQVLAQSKNEELESVYWDLVNRGTDKERKSPDLSNGPHSAKSTESNGKEKESVASSASSVHSETEASTPATTNGMTSPILSHEVDTMATAKLQAAMLAEKQSKAKEDTAALKKLEKAIRKDLGARTNYSKYTAAAGLQEALFGVCKAYALFDDGVGYAQGMNYIVMPLLFNMPEEEAFCLLVRLMNQYNLRDMFIPEMPGLHLHLYQFERLLEDVEPALCYHLHRRGITPHLYATQWFLTLFAYKLPLQLVLRVYDLILSEGLEGAILKFGIALMRKNAEKLLDIQDMSTLKVYLNDRLFDVYHDNAPSAHSILESGFFGSSGGIDKEVYRADLLVQDACSVRITPDLLRAYTTEWENRIRAEKGKEAEFESLRTANATLSLKIRSLEKRAEKSDTEQVQMATEMIRNKVENEELRDSNESLKRTTDELKRLVDAQPKEIEERLKEEMERIMARNIEVQNENRALEEQLGEMEKELVDTKMHFAEINSQHETLKQRWSDLRKALGD